MLTIVTSISSYIQWLEHYSLIQEFVQDIFGF